MWGALLQVNTLCNQHQNQNVTYSNPNLTLTLTQARTLLYPLMPHLKTYQESIYNHIDSKLADDQLSRKKSERVVALIKSVVSCDITYTSTPFGL